MNRIFSIGDFSLPRLRFGLVSSLAIFLAAASPALAQKNLRWKLAAGDQLQVNVNQQTTSSVVIPGNAMKSVKTRMEMTLETLWSVESANEKQIKISQTVKRLAVKLQIGDANPIAYDSATKTPPVGAAKDFAAAARPLLTEGST
jgi:hypothetical protein